MGDRGTREGTMDASVRESTTPFDIAIGGGTGGDKTGGSLAGSEVRLWKGSRWGALTLHTEAHRQYPGRHSEQVVHVCDGRESEEGCRLRNPKPKMFTR